MNLQAIIGYMFVGSFVGLMVAQALYGEGYRRARRELQEFIARSQERADKREIESMRLMRQMWNDCYHGHPPMSFDEALRLRTKGAN